MVNILLSNLVEQTNLGTFPVSTINAGFLAYFGLFMILLGLLGFCVFLYFYANWLKYEVPWNKFILKLKAKFIKDPSSKKVVKMGAVISTTNADGVTIVTEVEKSSQQLLEEQKALAAQQKAFEEKSDKKNKHKKEQQTSIDVPVNDEVDK